MTDAPLVDPQTCHVSVLPAEIVFWLQPRPGAVLVDGTAGGGGHLRLLLDAVSPGGTIVALDRDPAVVERLATRFAGCNVRLAQSNFRDLPEVLAEIAQPTVDGIVLDLGLSSDQLADESRGFSFAADGELDLRFDPTQGEPAWQLVNRLRADDLADLIFQYGEERHSRRIARRIVESRAVAPVRTAGELARLVRSCVPRTPGLKIDPATRTFQALRIAVNDELRSLESALHRLPNCLRPGGRLAIISFHSLEDRLVKQAFRDDERLSILTKKPVIPTDAELQTNPRSRSAKLRVAERVGSG